MIKKKSKKCIPVYDSQKKRIGKLCGKVIQINKSAKFNAEKDPVYKKSGRSFKLIQ